MKQSKFVSRVVAVLGLAGSLLLWGAAAGAAPPMPWDPRYDEWLQHEHEIEQYSKYYQGQDLPSWLFGGHCRGEVVAGAMGGAIGGLIGAQIGKKEGKAAATAAGAFLGYMLGREIGRQMDASDHACGIGPYNRTGDFSDVGGQFPIRSQTVMW